MTAPARDRKTYFRQYQATKRRLKRIMLKQASLCRQCQKPTAGRMLCSGCSIKENTRRPNTLEQLRLREEQLRRHARPTYFDRRWNGGPRHALTWALTQHCSRTWD